MNLRIASFAYAIGALSATPLLAQSLPPIVSPLDRATLEGDSWSSYPLGRWNCRVQQLHADLGTTARAISGHAYRRDAISTHGSVAAYQVDMSVTLSMSPNTPDTASATFADNEGQTVTVLPRTMISFPQTDRPMQAPAPTFELVVPYAMPFAYPAGGGTLCVDTTIYGNQVGSSANKNFSAYLDAHEQFPDGRAIQPGYRYGQGCAPPSGGAAAYCNFEMRNLTSGMELSIAARNGMASDASGPGMSALVTGFSSIAQPWPLRPSCTMLTSMDIAFPLPGSNDPTGAWDGVLQGFAPLPTGLTFYAQIASGHLLNGVALSDGSMIVVPPQGPMPVTVARIASGSDRASPTGTVSLVGTVTEFF